MFWRKKQRKVRLEFLNHFDKVVHTEEIEGNKTIDFEGLKLVELYQGMAYVTMVNKVRVHV